MIKLTYHGETHNMKEWSELLGIPYNVVKYRHRNGEPVEECLRQNVRKYKTAPKIVCGGCSLTFREWSELLHINPSAIYLRYYKGWSAKECLFGRANKKGVRRP